MRATLLEKLEASFVEVSLVCLSMMDLEDYLLELAFLQVKDVSGGCGSMFKLEIESEKFRGLTLVRQHKLVTGILKKEIGEMVRFHFVCVLPKLVRNHGPLCFCFMFSTAWAHIKDEDSSEKLSGACTFVTINKNLLDRRAWDCLGQGPIKPPVFLNSTNRAFTWLALVARAVFFAQSAI